MSAQPPEQQAGQETAQNSRPIIHDVLASRYASSHLLQLWSAEGKIRLERQFYILQVQVPTTLRILPQIRC